jgi:anthranilate phosphoribosyltransferase
MTNELLSQLIDKRDLTQSQAQALMWDLMSGTFDEAAIAALLVALRMKGEKAAEIAGFASAMREKSITITPERSGLVDTCGTGGDGNNTFNISTATALVAAAMGIGVAKHGNRAISSACGSADVLEAMGIRIDLTPEQVAELIDRIGVGFMFAPQLHPAMRYAAPVRKKLAIRTVFNLLGPLTNPAGVKRQLIGVYQRDLIEKLGQVLLLLGAEKAFVVHGADGGDEVSITGDTYICSLTDGELKTYTFAPEDAGLERTTADTIAGGTPEENGAIIEAILTGAGGPATNAVLLNAGFVAVLADKAPDVAAGVKLAAETIQAGTTAQLLDQYRELSHAMGSTGK